MRRLDRRRRAAIAAFCGMGTVMQFGGCDLGTFQTSVSLNGQEVVTGLLRGVLLNPIDAWITNAVNNLFDNDDD